MADNRLMIGVGFAAILVAFLMVAFFTQKDLTRGQWAILRFLCALCGGASGAFLTGEAMFKLSGQLGDGLSLAVSGTAGVALFFAVWYGFGKFVDRPPDSFTYAIGDSWTFKKAADGLASVDKAIAQFSGFTDEELNAPLMKRELTMTSVSEGLKILGSLSAQQKIRPYVVSSKPPMYALTITE